jgi:hypothetical protein
MELVAFHPNVAAMHPRLPQMPADGHRERPQPLHQHTLLVGECAHMHLLITNVGVRPITFFQFDIQVCF